MPPPLIADEMLGRLARHLRMIGCDTLYARGWSDEEIVARARADGRLVVTRDRALARRAAPAVLLTSVALPDQVRELRASLPDLPEEVRFDRCTLCNGRLAPFVRPGVSGNAALPGVPGDRPLYRCAECGHVYWEGSHTAHVRARVHEWTRRSTA